MTSYQPAHTSAGTAAEDGRSAPYPRTIRILHWLVVALVIVQWLTSGSMQAFFESRPAASLTAPSTAGSMLHLVTGATIFVVMIVRFFLRLKLGAPNVPQDLAKGLRILARPNHFAFYVVLVALPFTGAAALFFAPSLAVAHAALTKILLAIIVLHLSGVLYHLLFLRDGSIWRMARL